MYHHHRSNPSDTHCTNNSPTTRNRIQNGYPHSFVFNRHELPNDYWAEPTQVLTIDEALFSIRYNDSLGHSQIFEEFWNCANIRKDAAQGPDIAKGTRASETLREELPMRQPLILMGTGFNEFCPTEAIGEHDEDKSVQ
ncbi:hypothetical protein SARC_08868 [Sphaeroforma arctica JP610]|uniref:Uncharacterized protein n=1 Tax=Sphaeroforma arctica JP610 TaxID=667725 RepID=A0A0L0FPS5_9EUKA|nr:hypothetical protein SARC_08868 [Sphaeroforma arctica JP610]KNC78714.1 hypothetical protein SARC_08868 [Sphaeroforma arctica JP610]|eukprot:XP_014152616.1 hypothetical protein SARC_08868 [Sphaeroforma arctica JP610]